jgi:hypothetical protein
MPPHMSMPPPIGEAKAFAIAVYNNNNNNIITTTITTAV